MAKYVGSQFWRLGSKSRASSRLRRRRTPLFNAEVRSQPKLSDELCRNPSAPREKSKQILAPVRYSLVPFRDALYNLGEAIVDLALVPKQLEVDAINARPKIRGHEAYGETTNDYGAMDYNYDALSRLRRRESRVI